MLIATLALLTGNIDSLALLCRQIDASPTAAQLQAAHTDAATGLEMLADDAAQPAWLRARVVRLLALLDDGLPAIERLSQPGKAEVLRRASVSALRTRFRSSPKLLLQRLQPMLQDAAPSVRRAAALAVQPFAEAKPALRHQLRQEKDAGVRDALMLALSR